MGNFTSQPVHVKEPIGDGWEKVPKEEEQDEFDETWVTVLHPYGTYTDSDGDHCDSDGVVLIEFVCDETYLRSQLASTGSFDNPFFED